ncbi:MAG: isocitrate/isopropylmalate dehydrogenase family protein [Actinomycetia bacterium]|nr:isocitrate/isopropylmalate dehydrogenase family protein [Actinomycetes bacterium]
MSTYTIAIIRGDGIGPELVEAALDVLNPVAARHEFALEYVEVDAGADTYRRTGANIEPAGLDVIRRCDAAFKGPVGLPDVRLPDGTEAGLLGGVLRVGLDLFANVRPIHLYQGAPARLKVDAGGLDYVVIRENTEGMYLARGKGVGNREAMTDTLVVTRVGCERISRFAFEQARSRSGAVADGTSRVTLVDKANVLRSMYFFREIFLAVAAEYPDIEHECVHVDAAAQALVLTPEHFDVILTENLFGDILSDLGGGTVGGVAMCPSGNIGHDNAYFEPIHGSAPSIAGQRLANPIGQILSAAMMLDYLGQPAAADEIRDAVTTGLAGGAITLTAAGGAAGGPQAVVDAVLAELP